VLALAGALAASGCGTVDTPELEGKIEAGLKDMADLDAKVSCPEEVDLKSGDEFEREADADGEKLTIDARQKDDDGNIEWELKGPAE